MAKKPKNIKKPESPLKTKLRRYVLNLGSIIKEPDIPNLEFCIVFTHPRGPAARSFEIHKPKGESLIAIIHKTNINPEHMKILQEKNLLVDLNIRLKKLCYMKSIEYNIQLSQGFFLFITTIYLEDKISMNMFYKSVRNILDADLYAILMIAELLGDKSTLKEDDSGIGPSFYS